MNTNLFDMLDAFYTSNYIAKGIPATENEIAMAEKELNVRFDSDYKEFLLRYGGSMVKSIEVYGFNNSELMSDNSVVGNTD